MYFESFESSAAGMEEIPSKSARLKEILSKVSESEPATNAQEAYQIIQQSFNDVENAFLKVYRMEVLPFEKMESLSYAGRQILYSIYNSHVMFIGDNGAIDIRGIDKSFPATKKLFDKDPEFPKTQMKSFFSKPGADGMKVWQ